MRDLLRQLAKFASVGVVATALHVAVALALNHLAGVEALRANFCAFLVATTWSYFGNWAWTFGARSAVGATATKFFALSLTAFGVNQTIVYAVTKIAGLPLAVAMVPVVMVIPALTFWLSRSHIFAPHKVA